MFTTMAPKSAKPTSDELLAQFDDLGLEKGNDKSTTIPAPAAPAKDDATAEQEDILAELEKQAAQRPMSGPGTPRLSLDKARSATRSPRPGTTADQSTEDKSRLSADVPRSSTRQEQPKSEASSESVAPQQPEQSQSQSGGGGGWWGGLFAVAGAAVKQAEAAVKEIQKNEEAQRWAQQVKGNVGALRDFGNISLFF